MLAVRANRNGNLLKAPYFLWHFQNCFLQRTPLLSVSSMLTVLPRLYSRFPNPDQAPGTASEFSAVSRVSGPSENMTDFINKAFIASLLFLVLKCRYAPPADGAGYILSCRLVLSNIYWKNETVPYPHSYRVLPLITYPGRPGCNGLTFTINYTVETCPFKFHFITLTVYFHDIPVGQNHSSW